MSNAMNKTETKLTQRMAKHGYVTVNSQCKRDWNAAVSLIAKGLVIDSGRHSYPVGRIKTSRCIDLTISTLPAPESNWNYYQRTRTD